MSDDQITLVAKSLAAFKDSDADARSAKSGKICKPVDFDRLWPLHCWPGKILLLYSSPQSHGCNMG